VRRIMRALRVLTMLTPSFSVVEEIITYTPIPVVTTTEMLVTKWVRPTLLGVAARPSSRPEEAPWVNSMLV
jgi:hypothetical protein